MRVYSYIGTVEPLAVHQLRPQAPVERRMPSVPNIHIVEDILALDQKRQVFFGKRAGLDAKTCGERLFIDGKHLRAQTQATQPFVAIRSAVRLLLGAAIDAPEQGRPAAVAQYMHPAQANQFLVDVVHLYCGILVTQLAVLPEHSELISGIQQMPPLTVSQRGHDSFAVEIEPTELQTKAALLAARTVVTPAQLGVDGIELSGIEMAAVLILPAI